MRSGLQIPTSLVTHVVFKDGTVYLLSIYDKSDIENLTDNEVLELVKMIP